MKTLPSFVPWAKKCLIAAIRVAVSAQSSTVMGPSKTQGVQPVCRIQIGCTPKKVLHYVFQLVEHKGGRKLMGLALTVSHSSMSQCTEGESVMYRGMMLSQQHIGRHVSLLAL